MLPPGQETDVLAREQELAEAERRALEFLDAEERDQQQDECWFI